MRPQSILIFLPDGSPRSVKIAEITNRVVKAILVPRNKIDYISKREELKNVGLYFLFGENTEGIKPLLYVGEAENCLDRIKQHNKQKDFWNYAIVFISKINAFTKSHAKFLEHVAIKQAKENNRYKLENGNTPSAPYVTESMEADLLDSFETVKILLSTLGYPVYDRAVESTRRKQDQFFVKAKKAEASGSLVDDGFVVFKGSKASIDTTPSCHDHLINLREKLLNSEVIKLSEDQSNYIFMENYVFNSPSTAGGVVLGRSTNGWTKWKDQEGRTLDEVKRQSDS